MSDPSGRTLAEDALLGLLLPFWQLVIGLFVIVALVAAAYRLGRRGPSRMRTAMFITGGAIVGITLVGIFTQGGP